MKNELDYLIMAIILALLWAMPAHANDYTDYLINQNLQAQQAAHEDDLHAAFNHPPAQLPPPIFLTQQPIYRFVCMARDQYSCLEWQQVRVQ